MGILFADDTTICHTGTPLAGVIRETDSLLSRPKLWFTSNKLKLNEEKPQCMICLLGPQVEENSKSVKLLGFVLDPRILWKKHAAFICTKLTRMVYLLRRLVNTCWWTTILYFTTI
ncbi:hypothetical protein J6590_024838 [Homalodisca vitripennis]|nr:hypothetical protein J6590_024838 [Homalodisca vitripennis]